MKNIFMSLAICMSFHVVAQESFVDKVSNKLWELIEQTKVQLGLTEPVDNHLTMPEIPQPRNNPLDLKVYQSKIADLYPGTRAFLKLSHQEKKKQSVGFIIEAYQVAQLRQATRAEVSSWLNGLLQGGSREGVYRGIVYNNDYRNLEAMQLFTTQEALSFSVTYLRDFLEKKAQEDLLRKLDIYSLKKIVVKTTLKTLETMATEPESLMIWYAIFSGQLAKKYPHVWKFKLRANQDERVHLEWAKQAAYQQIITEVIVKLHKTFNYLGKLSLNQ